MPYRRRYRGRRAAKKSSGARTAKRVAHREAVKVVRQQTESKMYDGIVSTTSIDYFGGVSPLGLLTNPSGGTTIVQGTADYNYVGSRITPSYITIRGILKYNTNDALVRIIVVQNSGPSPPSSADLLSNNGTTYTVLSPYNRTTNNRYKVLADRMYNLTATDVTSRNIKIKIPGKSLRRVFFSDTVGGIERGGLYIYWYSNVGISYIPTGSFVWRVHYRDL